MRKIKRKLVLAAEDLLIIAQNLRSKASIFGEFLSDAQIEKIANEINAQAWKLDDILCELNEAYKKVEKAEKEPESRD